MIDLQALTKYEGYVNILTAESNPWFIQCVRQVLGWEHEIIFVGMMSSQ